MIYFSGQPDFFGNSHLRITLDGRYLGFIICFSHRVFSLLGFIYCLFLNRSALNRADGLVWSRLENVLTWAKHGQTWPIPVTRQCACKADRQVGLSETAKNGWHVGFLVGGLVAIFIHFWHFPIYIGNHLSSQLTKSYFSEGWPWPTNHEVIHGWIVVVTGMSLDSPSMGPWSVRKHHGFPFAPIHWGYHGDMFLGMWWNYDMIPFTWAKKCNHRFQQQQIRIAKGYEELKKMSQDESLRNPMAGNWSIKATKWMVQYY